MKLATPRLQQTLAYPEKTMSTPMKPTALPNRIGFHYFPDTSHYTNRDLITWLPILKSLSASWVILRAEAGRAIPERFLAELIQAGITPLIHIHFPLPETPNPGSMRALMQAYASWGVHYVILFDKPNLLQSWSASGWTHEDLVERFIDKFIPLAQCVVQAGMQPIFPPLQPGGNYWDLSFFKQSFQSLLRRRQDSLVNSLSVAAYAYTYNHELDWGLGGFEKWPGVKPYLTSSDVQNQIGFNQYQWLQSIAKKITGQMLPFFLMGAGLKDQNSVYAPELHAEIVDTIIKRLNSPSTGSTFPDYVKACNFAYLSVDPNTNVYSQAWFKTSDDSLPIVRILTGSQKNNKPVPPQVESTMEISSNETKPEISHPIEHYLLLPVYDWGVADYHLDATRPFIQKHHPTVGFSPEEAAHAKRVTVIGGLDTFSDDLLAQLRNHGCVVERISGYGTSIATQLSER